MLIACSLFNVCILFCTWGGMCYFACGMYAVFSSEWPFHEKRWDQVSGKVVSISWSPCSTHHLPNTTRCMWNTCNRIVFQLNTTQYNTILNDRKFQIKTKIIFIGALITNLHSKWVPSQWIRNNSYITRNVSYIFDWRYESIY